MRAIIAENKARTKGGGRLVEFSCSAITKKQNLFHKNRRRREQMPVIFLRGGKLQYRETISADEIWNQMDNICMYSVWRRSHLVQ